MKAAEDAVNAVVDLARRLQDFLDAGSRSKPATSTRPCAVRKASEISRIARRKTYESSLRLPGIFYPRCHSLRRTLHTTTAAA